MLPQKLTTRPYGTPAFGRLCSTSKIGVVTIVLAHPKVKEVCHQIESPPCPRQWRATDSAHRLTPVDGPSYLRTHHAETPVESSALSLFRSCDCSYQTKPCSHSKWPRQPRKADWRRVTGRGDAANARS